MFALYIGVSIQAISVNEVMMKFVKTIKANVSLSNTQKIKICKQSLISKVKILAKLPSLSFTQKYLSDRYTDLFQGFS